MTATVITVVQNEQEMLPFFLLHYEQFCTAIHIYDDGSTDATRDIARAHPLVTLFDYPGQYPIPVTKGLLHEHERTLFFNWVYRQQTADWVMLVDVDEHLWQPDGMAVALRWSRARGDRLLFTDGYNMVSETFPRQGVPLMDQIRVGTRSRYYNKSVIADSGLDIEWGTGRHQLVHAEIPDVHAGFKLLHYRFLGKEWTLARTRRNLEQVKACSPEATPEWLRSVMRRAERDYTRLLTIREPLF
jgi:hypothetical protein